MTEQRTEPAFLFIRVSVEHVAFDPFILDYKRFALTDFCKKNGYEPFENLLHGGIGNESYFRNITFPFLRNLVKRMEEPPRFLITCYRDELGLGAVAMLNEIHITTITIFENEKRDNLWLPRCG